MSTRFLPAALAALLASGGLAIAQDKPEPKPADKLVLTLETEQAEVPVGDVITATVKLTNNGDEPVTLPKLFEDRQVVSFDVQLDKGKVFRFERIHLSPTSPRTSWDSAELKPKESWELKVTFPTLIAGELTITPHYARTPDARVKPKPPALVGKPLKVRVVKTKAGANAVAVVMRTTYGPIRMRLYPREALGTCLHFARLITDGAYANGDSSTRLRKPFYEGLVFHRIARNFVIQGGCPNGQGDGGAGFCVPNEAPKRKPNTQTPERARHLAGRLSMAKSDHPDSGGTQFFIVTGRNNEARHLDHVHTVFGEVSRGLDVVFTIAEVPTQGPRRETPEEDIRIEHISLKPIKER